MQNASSPANIVACKRIMLMVLAGVSVCSVLATMADESTERNRVVVLLRGTTASEVAPHGEGNVYAPDIRVENGMYRMWYGAQGKDGHDRILYAESNDGVSWKKKGVVIEDATANHVNDPSVVYARGGYFMYYTVAGLGVTDRIDVATSKDGIEWKRVATALRPGEDDDWDALLVGRPSVLFEDGIFKMWYDGRKDLPVGAPDKNAPQSATSKRGVGYATSKDGLRWTRHRSNPVYGNDAGGVHVVRRANRYLMVYESREGVRLATSADGVSWRSGGTLVERSGAVADEHGHVTPFVLQSPNSPSYVYFGAAAAAAWNQNSIARAKIESGALDRSPTE